MSLHDHRDVSNLDELHEEDSDHLVKVLQLRNFHSFQHEEYDMHNNGHVTTLSKNWTPTSMTCTTGTSTTTSKKAHAARNAASPAPPHHNRRDPATAPPTCPFLTEPQPTLALTTKVPGSASTAQQEGGLHDAAIVV